MARIQIQIIFDGHFIQIFEYSNICAHHCKQVPVGLLHAEKMVEVVLLNAFRIGFQASFFLYYDSSRDTL